MPTIVMNKQTRMTAEEIEARVWAFVIVCLILILLGSVAMFLYALTYVTQPMNGQMAAIDKVYTQQISTIMVFVAPNIYLHGQSVHSEKLLRQY